MKEFDSGRENFWGAIVTEEVKKEMWDALGDSPVGAMITCACYLVSSIPVEDEVDCWILASRMAFVSFIQRFWSEETMYFQPFVLESLAFSSCFNFTDLNPKAEMYTSNQFWQIIISDIGVFIWLGAIIASIYHFGFQTVFRVYLVPYLWYDLFLPINYTTVTLTSLGSTTG